MFSSYHAPYFWFWGHFSFVCGCLFLFSHGVMISILAFLSHFLLSIFPSSSPFIFLFSLFLIKSFYISDFFFWFQIFGFSLCTLLETQGGSWLYVYTKDVSLLINFKVSWMNPIPLQINKRNKSLFNRINSFSPWECDPRWKHELFLWVSAVAPARFPQSKREKGISRWPGSSTYSSAKAALRVCKCHLTSLGSTPIRKASGFYKHF